MWQHCSLSAEQRKTTPVADSILVSDHTDLSRFCHTWRWIRRIVYLLNLIHEFTSFFSTKVIYAALPKKTFPWKQAFVGHQCFSVVAQATPKIRPRPAERLNQFSRWKKLGKAAYAEIWWVQCANMWQHCNLAAVQRKTAFLEQSWWFGSKPRTRSFQGWRKRSVVQSTF